MLSSFTSLMLIPQLDPEQTGYNAALFTAETIQSLNDQEQLFISRAPQKLTLIKQAIAEQKKDAFTALENGYTIFRKS